MTSSNAAAVSRPVLQHRHIFSTQYVVSRGGATSLAWQCTLSRDISSHRTACIVSPHITPAFDVSYTPPSLSLPTPNLSPLRLLAQLGVLLRRRTLHSSAARLHLRLPLLLLRLLGPHLPHLYTPPHPQAQATSAPQQHHSPSPGCLPGAGTHAPSSPAARAAVRLEPPSPPSPPLPPHPSPRASQRLAPSTTAIAPSPFP